MGSGPANQFDSLQVCLHHFHVPHVLLLFYLTTERSLFDQSCQIPDFLATASCQGKFLCSELSTIFCAIGLSPSSASSDF